MSLITQPWMVCGCSQPEPTVSSDIMVRGCIFPWFLTKHQRSSHSKYHHCKWPGHDLSQPILQCSGSGWSWFFTTEELHMEGSKQGYCSRRPLENEADSTFCSPGISLEEQISPDEWLKALGSFSLEKKEAEGRPSHFL